MSGKGNCYENAAVETFFKTIKAELIWCGLGKHVGIWRRPSCNISTAFITRADGIKHWEEKPLGIRTPSGLNEYLERHQYVTRTALGDADHIAMALRTHGGFKGQD